MFAGGDMMPLVMPWPKQGKVMSSVKNAAARNCFGIALFSTTANQRLKPLQPSISFGTTKVVPFHSRPTTLAVPITPFESAQPCPSCYFFGGLTAGI